MFAFSFGIVFQGPANKGCKCATCHANFGDCPGHYGYVNLALPVFNVGYFTTILEILKCICKVLKRQVICFPWISLILFEHYFSSVEVSLQSCSRILLEEKLFKDFLRKMRNPKLEALRKVDLVKKIIKKCSTLTTGNKSTRCSRCGYLNGLDFTFYFVVYSSCSHLYVIHNLFISAL